VFGRSAIKLRYDRAVAGLTGIPRSDEDTAMIKNIFASILALFGLVFFVAPSIAATQFECHPPLDSSTPGILAKIKSQLPDANAMADIGRLTTAIGVLRQDGMPKIRIIDELVNAYCPIIAQQSALTAAEKAASVRRFSGKITQLVYSLESGFDVIINVPFTPDVVDAINTKARKQGLSGSAWISMTIENALQLQ
jgi:hypothetical protein